MCVAAAGSRVNRLTLCTTFRGPRRTLYKEVLRLQGAFLQRPGPCQPFPAFLYMKGGREGWVGALPGKVSGVCFV